MKLQFVSSGDYQTYEVVDYRGPYHEQRVELWTHAWPLFDGGGRKRYNYTPEEYQKDVLSLVGYARFHWSPRPPVETMLEVARILNEDARKDWEQAYEKYPDAVEPWVPLCKGIAYWMGDGWTTVDLGEANPHMGV